MVGTGTIAVLDLDQTGRSTAELGVFRSSAKSGRKAIRRVSDRCPREPIDAVTSIGLRPFDRHGDGAFTIVMSMATISPTWAAFIRVLAVRLMVCPIPRSQRQRLAISAHFVCLWTARLL
jgi:hypothetical protein